MFMIIYDVINLKLKDIKQSSDSFTVRLTNYFVFIWWWETDTFSCESSMHMRLILK